MSYSLSFTKAIFVVIFISDKIRQGQNEFLSTTLISEMLNIPRPTLVKILQHLSAAGMIQTKEGKHGGIRLMKDPAEITVLDIFEAVEKGKPLFQTSFDIFATGKRPSNAQTAILTLFEKTEDKMKMELAHTTVAQILEEMDE
jgi:Rrf2 family protein